MSKKKIIALVVLAAIVIAYTVLSLLPKPQNYTRDNPLMKDGDMPILVAHRGGDGEFPGNTLEAFYNAYSVDRRVVLETDASITKDGVLILCHDTYLDDYTNVTGSIIDWSYADMMAEEVDFGYNNDMEDGKVVELLPFLNENDERVTPLDVEYPAGVTARHDEIFLATTLEELIVAFPDNIISVEIKQDGEAGLKAHKEALRLIDEYDAHDRIIVASFHGEIYEKSMEVAADDGAHRNLMYSPSIMGVIKYVALYCLGLDIFFNDGIAVLQIPMEEYGIELSTDRLINNAHKHNIAVHYWTVNDEDEMRKLIEIGADGIMTDYPHRLKAVYDSYNN